MGRDRPEDVVQRKMEEFQVALMDSLPSGKEVREQRKKAKKTYRVFLKVLNSQEWLDEIEEQTNVPRLFLFYGLVLVMGAITVLSFFVKFMGLFMTRTLGFIFPMYSSIKALITDDKSDDTQWLMYWVIYAGFALFEQVALEQSKTLPIFFSVKLVFLFWCQFLNGAELLYKLFVKPVAMAIRKVSGG